MRLRTIVAAAAAAFFVSATAVPAAASVTGSAPALASVVTPVIVAQAYQDPPAQPPVGGDVDINIGTESGAWYADPLWIAIGVIALLIIALVIGLAARGGGQSGATIVK